jgi:four helix bundle protein
MEPTDWTVQQKPYNLRERLLLYACLIVRLTQFLHSHSPVARALSYQLLKCGTSAGANYEEADGGSSRRDRLAKRRIVLRELMEASFRLRVLRRTGILTCEHDPVIAETTELIKIVATIIRKSRPPNAG